MKKFNCRRSIIIFSLSATSVAVLSAIVLAVFSFCRNGEHPPRRITGFGGVVIGETRFPRHGEGELFSVKEEAVVDGFNRISVEVVPFEHRVFRIVADAEAVSSAGIGELDAVAGTLEAKFHIKFTAVSPDMKEAVLPESRVIVRRSFHLGPQAVSVEIIDLKLAEEAEKLKAGSRYTEARQIRRTGENAAILCRAVEEYIQDCGSVPDTLEDLLVNRSANRRWLGPYYQGKLPPDCHYRPAGAGKYELFFLVNGKRIGEDVLL